MTSRNTTRDPLWWDRYFMKMAALAAEPSKDPSTQVGCVLVNQKRRVIGMGYNGFPKGVDDCPDRYNDRPTKYLMVQHAEANAVLNAVAGTDGATAYVTHFPCSTCAGTLIQAGIVKIVTYTPDAGLADRFCDSFNASQTMFDEAGIELVRLDGPKS